MAMDKYWRAAVGSTSIFEGLTIRYIPYLDRDRHLHFSRMVKARFETLQRLKNSPFHGRMFKDIISEVNDKLILRTCEDGVTIIPKDGSYIRFISDDWYDGVDPESI